MVAVGGWQAIEALASPGYAKIDLKGRRALPGLIDTYAHLLDTGFSYIKLNLGLAENVEEVLRARAVETRKRAPGEWSDGIISF